MNTNLDLEIKLIKQYIVKNKQDRFIGFVSDLKKRDRFIDELAHFNYFKPDKFERLTKSGLADIEDKLMPYKDCYVVSENTAIDGKRLNISNALMHIVGYDMGTIIILGDADKVYYEGESMNDRWVSK